MKTIIILLACIACLVGCKKPNKERIGDYFEVQSLVIDSCDYLLYIKTTGTSITHKGNCKYCIERKFSLLVDAWGTHGETSDMPLTVKESDGVKLGGTLTPNTTITSKWTYGTDIAPKKSELMK